MKNAILLVDDEANVTAALKRALMDEDIDIHTADSGEAGLEKMGMDNFKIVISDERMPGMGGAEFLSLVKERYPETLRMMLTGHASIESTMKAVNSGEIYRFFTKPWNDFDLIVAIRSAIEKFDMEAENRRLLKTVRRQATELKTLETLYPGITSIERDDQGHLMVTEVSEEELQDIISQCCRECTQ